MEPALRYWLLLCAVTLWLHPEAQVTVKPDAQLTVLTGTELRLSQEVRVENTGTFQNFGTIFFKGDFINNGLTTLDPSSRLYANGTTRQTISGNNVLTIPFLGLNNSAGVQLSAPILISDTLKMINGMLHATESSPVQFLLTAADPDESNASHIIGKAVMLERPTGTSAFQPFLGFQMTPGADVGDVTLIRRTGADVVATRWNARESITANWTISSTSQPVNDRTLSFNWISAMDNGNDMTVMDLYAKNTEYDKVNTVSKNVSASDPRSFSLSGIENFNRSFTLFDTSVNYLIQFLHFTGNKTGNDVQLNWTTGPEKYNAGYDVERSLDGSQFTKIGFVAGKNQAVNNIYDFLDNGLAGINQRAVYYRLRQVYTNGNFQHSPIVVVSLNGSTLYKLNVYPNPFYNDIKIDMEKGDNDPVEIRLVDMKGSVVFRRQYPIGRSGRIELKGLQFLAAGGYILNIYSPHFRETIKLSKIQ